jgi:phospholipase C
MGISRRRFIGGAATIAATAAVAQASSATAQTATGTIRDVKHVVVLMQENRSFDHYFGSLKGVRGYADQSTLNNIFHQPTWAGGRRYPWRMSLTAPVFGDSGDILAQCDGSLLHSWNSQHSAWAGGAMNNWVFATLSDRSLGFLNRADIPFHYALADNYTVCDAYHCSILSSTGPNRTFLWSGMIDPNGTAGGPAQDGGEADGLRWQTYAETLETAGVSWKVYQNADDNYGDNGLAYFEQFQNAPAGSPLRVKGMGSVPRVTGATHTDIAAAIRADVLAGTLPQVSWVVANKAFSEHPDGPPRDGAHFINLIMQALNANPATFNSTVLFLNYDENDGFFDHVPPPIPPAGTAGEFIGGTNVGLGFRVPMIVVSPWSRGGWVDSQVYDHTSVIRFLETWTAALGKPATCPHISAWRRAVCGDLTRAFDFTTKTTGMPALPATGNIIGQAWCDSKTNPNSDTVANTPPTQEPGTKPARALPYQPTARFARWEQGGTSGLMLWLEMSQFGSYATKSTTYTIAVNKYRGGGPWHYTVGAPSGGIPGAAEDFFNIGSGYGDGKYDLTLLGPNRFLRRYEGDYYRSAQCEATAEYRPDATGGPALSLLLSNNTTAERTFTLRTNQYVRALPWTVRVAAGAKQTVAIPMASAHAGWYDVTATLDADPLWKRRFAGHIENGRPGVTGSYTRGVLVNLRAVANNQYVCADNWGTAPLIANRSGAGEWETFDLITNPDSTVSLVALANGQYVSAENAGTEPLIASRTAIGTWEKFVRVDNSDGTISLRSVVNNKYVCAEDAGTRPLIANRSGIGPWEKFILTTR